MVRLELGVDDALCRVDPERFTAAILNLVVNARDAMPVGGEVVISSVRVKGAETDQVRVRVADSGTGMEKKVAERMFEPWFTTKPGAGTGMGLPAVRRFMILAGGEVCVETDKTGTSFDLVFPIVHRVAGSAGAEAAEAPVSEPDRMSEDL